MSYPLEEIAWSGNRKNLRGKPESGARDPS
jgi:hypothetical protein